jgi:hypothetical protein
MRNVHRALLMALTWVASTAAGVVLGWQGVQLVTFQVVESQAAPLSQPHVLEALEAAGGSPGPATVSPATPEIPAPQAAPTPTPAPKVLPRSGGHLPAPFAPGAGSPPVPITVTAAAVAPTTTTTVTTSPAPVTTPTTAVAKEPTTTTTTRAKPKQEPKPAQRPPEPDKPVYRMIPAKGGTVAVRFQSGRVQLLWARPNDGFRVEVEEDGDNEVVVVFRSRDHRSRIRAFWANGTPRQQVVERPTGTNYRDDD